MTIKCTNFKPYSKNTLRGFATLYDERTGMEIRNVTYHEKGERSWISLPEKEVMQNGERKFYSFIGFPEKERYYQYMDAAREAVKAKINEGTSFPIPPETEEEQLEF